MARITAIVSFMLVSSGYRKRALASILTMDKRMLLLFDSLATVMNAPAGICTDTLSTSEVVLAFTGMELEVLELLLYVWKRPSNAKTEALIARTLIVKLLRTTVTT